MFDFMLRPIRKRRQKATFEEYGCTVKEFRLTEYGRVQYAQWLHPSEREKTITDEMIRSLQTYIREGDTVIDIGAHTGDTTVPMALAAGATGLTLALEPNPYVFRILEKNAGLNPELTHIVPLNIAATEMEGEFIFNYSDASYCNGGYLSHMQKKRALRGHRYPLRVQGKNLEKLLRKDYAERLGRLSYVKIDVEGYDKDIIRSIRGVLREYRPVVVTEVYKRLVTEERQALYTVMDEAGYTCFRYLTGVNERGERVQQGDLMKWPTFDILGIPKERA